MLSPRTPHPDGSSQQVAADDPAAEVRRLADEWLEATLLRSPELVTQLGLTGRNHGGVMDNSLAALREWEAREDQWLARAQAIPEETVSGQPEWATLGVLREHLESAVQLRIVHAELMPVSQMAGWQTVYPLLAQFQPVGTPELRQQALARAQALPSFINTEVENLHEGARTEYLAPRLAVARVLEQLDGLLAPKAAESVWLSPAERDPDPDFRAALEAVVEQDVMPSIRLYRNYLRDTYILAARHTPGIADLPCGEAGYRAAVRSFTTLDLDPREIHELGLREVERIAGAMRSVAERSFGTGDLAVLLARFRTDAQFTFGSREEIVAYAEQALQRAKAGVGDAFNLLPRADVVIEPYPAFEEGSAPDSYHNPAEDGSRPGLYRINTRDPEKKSRVGLESTAFHETIPGHHLQIAIAQERPGAHPVSRFLGNSGYVEGWALYAEQLADQLGWFSGDLDRMGLLNNTMLRAARLVVDPGIHVLGWSRQQAIDFLTTHTAESPDQAALEVDRYSVLPGQAVSYLIGQLEITRLRDQTRQALGPDWELRSFHDRVLEDGAVTLPMLRAKLERWTRAGSAGAPV